MLERTKNTVAKDIIAHAEPTKIGGNEFELQVFERSKENAAGTKYEGKLVHTSDRDFPDIVAADFFGVEVKITKKDDWISIGNSVLESSRVKSVEKIYLFFGKLGGKPDIKFRNYEDCLKSIAVTHYPRYQIDMLLQNGQSIFDKMNVPYQELRKQSNPVKAIRKYYLSQLKEGEELWWVNDNLDDSSAPTPVIKFFSSLSREEKDRIKAEIFVYVPEILSSSSTKFNRVAAYLASAYGVISSNLRDHFTAGGQVEINIAGKPLRIPQIVSEALRLKPLIDDVLKYETQESLANRWLRKVDEIDPKQAWLNEVDRQTTDSWKVIRLSELYEQTHA